MANIFTRLLGYMGAMPRVAPMKEQGTSGTAIYGGAVAQIERSPKWTGQQKYITSADIAVNVSIVAASVHYFLNLIAHPRWTVKPKDESGKAKQLAEFVEDVMYDMELPWSRVVRRTGSYRFYGFSVQEWVAKKRDDGRIGLLTIEPRPQATIENWAMEDDGTVLGVWQRSPQTMELLPLPRGKIVYLADDTLSDSPEGLGMFRHMGEPYERLKLYLELEARAYERDLRGIPIGKAPITKINQLVSEGNLTQAEGEKQIKGMRDFLQMEVKKSNSSLLLDSMPYENPATDGLKITGTPQWAVELLTGPALGLTEIANAIDRLQREMSRILGTEHLMMGDAGGNRALAVDKSRNLYLIANSVLELIAGTYERDILMPLWKLNNFPDELRPSLETEDVTFKDVDQVTGALARMAQAGAVLAPDDPAINDVRELLGISPAELTAAIAQGSLLGPSEGGNSPGGPRSDVGGPGGPPSPGEEGGGELGAKKARE